MAAVEGAAQPVRVVGYGAQPRAEQFGGRGEVDGGLGLVPFPAQRPDLAQHAAELAGHVPGGGEPAVRVAGRGPFHHQAEGAGTEAGYVVADRPAREFGQGHPDGVDVVGDGQRSAVVRLGGRESGGDHGGRLGDAAPAHPAEVDDLDAVVPVDDIGRLHVPVQEFHAVQMGEGFEDLAAVGDDVFDVEDEGALPGRFDDRGERTVADVVHHDVAAGHGAVVAAGADEVPDADDAFVPDGDEAAALLVGLGGAPFRVAVEEPFTATYSSRWVSSAR